jgi:hypothetical protein
LQHAAVLRCHTHPDGQLHNLLLGDLLHRHELNLQLDGESADLLGAALEGQTLAVNIDDLVANTLQHSQSLSYLVGAGGVAMHRCDLLVDVHWRQAVDARTQIAAALWPAWRADCLASVMAQVRETKVRLNQAVTSAALCEPMAA